MAESDGTASLMTPAKLANIKPHRSSTPAAWLDQMAADAGHMHLGRIAELCGMLAAQGARRDLGPLSARLAALGAALPQLDFSLLQPVSWWARTVGKGRSAGAGFAAQFEAADEAARALAAQVQSLQTGQQADAAAGERALLELEVEFRAIDKIIDQGARWLQDMRGKLKTRRAAIPPADAAGQQEIGEDAARCEILVVRLKALRAASTAAAHAHEQALATAGRRKALAQMLQQAMGSDVKAWRGRLSPLAASATGSAAPALDLEGPRTAHTELQICVQQAVADCAQLQAHEQSLAQALAALEQQLQAGA
jgi:hypothetical protein